MNAGGMEKIGRERIGKGEIESGKKREIGKGRDWGWMDRTMRKRKRKRKREEGRKSRR